MDCESYHWQHHRTRRGVGDPHAHERGDNHKSQHEPFRIRAEQKQDFERYTLVESAHFNGICHHQPAIEQHYYILKVDFTDCL